MNGWETGNLRALKWITALSCDGSQKNRTCRVKCTISDARTTFMNWSMAVTSCISSDGFACCEIVGPSTEEVEEV